MSNTLMLDTLKIAIVCDWLTVFAGAERVVLEIHELFPDAPIYTTLFNKKNCASFKSADVRESYLRFIPGARFLHRLFLPSMPRVFESFDLSQYDIVISSSHSAAKGIITKPETLHVSYCHSPMRYVWDHSHSYIGQFRSFAPFRLLFRPVLHRIRMWDRVAAERVDRFIANSAYVASRIQKYYHRTSEIIYPPVDLSFFEPGKDKGKCYLAIGRLIPYKRFDLVIEACGVLKRPLIVVGEGPELNRLKKHAKKIGANVQFLGKISDEDLRQVYQAAKALIFPQMEDFGIVPLEAMASGTPVIALSQGGALETVKENVSGVFFKEQTKASLVSAMHRVEKRKWNPQIIADSVTNFAAPRFRSEFRHFLEKTWKEHKEMIG